MKKMFKQDMHILRFNAKLVSTEPDDESRTLGENTSLPTENSSKE